MRLLILLPFLPNFYFHCCVCASAGLVAEREKKKAKFEQTKRFTIEFRCDVSFFFLFIFASISVRECWIFYEMEQNDWYTQVYTHKKTNTQQQHKQYITTISGNNLLYIDAK